MVSQWVFLVFSGVETRDGGICHAGGLGDSSALGGAEGEAARTQDSTSRPACRPTTGSRAAHSRVPDTADLPALPPPCSTFVHRPLSKATASHQGTSLSLDSSFLSVQCANAFARHSQHRVQSAWSRPWGLRSHSESPCRPAGAFPHRSAERGAKRGLAGRSALCNLASASGAAGARDVECANIGGEPADQGPVAHFGLGYEAHGLRSE